MYKKGEGMFLYRLAALPRQEKLRGANIGCLLAFVLSETKEKVGSRSVALKVFSASGQVSILTFYVIYF